MESIIIPTNEDIKSLRAEHGYIGRVVSYALLGMPIPQSYARMLRFEDDVFSVDDIPFARLFRENGEVVSAVVLYSACPGSCHGYKLGDTLACLKKLNVPTLYLLISPWLRYPFPQLSEFRRGASKMYLSAFDTSKDHAASIKNLYALNLIQYLRMYEYNDWSRHKRAFWYRRYDWPWPLLSKHAADDWEKAEPQDILYKVTIQHNHKQLLTSGIPCPYDIKPAEEAADKIRQKVYPPRKNRLSALLDHYREFLEDISYGEEEEPCGNDLVKVLLSK